MRMGILTAAWAAALVLATAPAWAQTSTPAGGGERIVVPSETTPGAGAPAAPAVKGTNGTVEAQGTGGEKSRPAGGMFGGDSNWFIFVMLGALVLMWVWMGRGQRKERKKHQQMLEAMKKGDKITTIGGIIGTVIEVKPTEVTVKVDESANVRMKFIRSAIRSVGDAGRTEADAAGGKDQSPSK